MKQIVFAFLFTLAFSLRADDNSYLLSMIACEEKEERFVDDTFNSFNVLSVGRGIKKAELRFPVRLTTEYNGMITFERGFYLTPNILRGFALRVPKDLLKQVDGLWISTAPLIVAAEDSRQGVTTLTLKVNPPNQALEPTPTAVTDRAAHAPRQP
jgi:hypothetical protein